MANVLEVQIIGDVSSLEKSLKSAEKLQAEYTAKIQATSNELKENIAVSNGYKQAIEQLNAEYRKGSISSKEYTSQLEKLKRDEKETTLITAGLRKELANLKREQNDLGGSMQKNLTPKIANGSNALMQFSRIAQDAPFGIMGIGNNITATVEAFGHLQKSTGSAGSALKAMASSMLGSGGILLAVSLVTSALTYMSQNGLTVGDIVKKMTGNFDSARKAMQDLNVEAVKGSQGQISTMNAYVSVAKDVNLSMSDRLIAVKKLQSEYPAYFGNLTKEQILNGNVASAVAGATKALIAKAKAAAAVEKIVGLAEEEEKLQNEINNALTTTAKQYKLTKKEAFEFGTVFNQQLRGQIDLFAKAEKVGANNLSTIEKAVLTTLKIAPGYLEAQKNLQSLRSEQDRYTDSINENIASQIKLDTVTEKTKKVNKKDEIIPFKSALEPILDVEKTEFYISKVADEYGILRDKVFKVGDIKTDAVIEAPKPEVSAAFIDDLNRLKGLMSEYKKVTGQTLTLPEVVTTDYINSLDNALKAAELFSNASSAAIGALASDMSRSLETGNSALDAFVGSVIQGLAQVATAQLSGLIAKQTVATASLATDAAVSTGNAVTAATSTAAATGPAAAFVLPALVGAAIGFIAAAFSGIKFAHGGVVPGGSFTGDKIPAMLNSGETVLNNRQQANVLMAVANSNSNSLQGNRKSSNFVLDTKLRGSDLLLSIKRAEKDR